MPSLLVCRVSTEKSTIAIQEFPYMFLFAFYFAAFTVLSLSFSHFNYRVSWCVRLWLILCGTLCFLDLGDCFLSSVMGILSCYVFTYILNPFLSLFSFWNPWMWIWLHLTLPQRSFILWAFLLILFSFFFCSAAVIFSTVFQLTDPFLSIIYSAVESF